MPASASRLGLPPMTTTGPPISLSGVVPPMKRASVVNSAWTCFPPAMNPTWDSAGLNWTCRMSYRWNQVPFSPPGLSPKDLNWSATYCAVISRPGLGVSRPIIESSAMTLTRRATSEAVMVAAAFFTAEDGGGTTAAGACAASGEAANRAKVSRCRMRGLGLGESGERDGPAGKLRVPGPKSLRPDGRESFRGRGVSAWARRWPWGPTRTCWGWVGNRRPAGRHCRDSACSVWRGSALEACSPLGPVAGSPSAPAWPDPAWAPARHAGPRPPAWQPGPEPLRATGSRRDTARNLQEDAHVETCTD